MAGKDIAEKELVYHRKIFADVLNAYRNDGEQIFNGADLYHLKSRSPTLINGDLHDQDRDIFKLWAPKDEFGNPIRCARIGIEIQTAEDKYMALRIAGYDGADYHAQYINYKRPKKDDSDEDAGFTPVPVITYVLYFGLTHWTTSRSLDTALDISNSPAIIKRDFDGSKFRVFEVAFSTEKQIQDLKSDFKYVAQALVEYRLMHEKGERDISKLKQALDTDFEYPYEVTNLITEILNSDDFGKDVLSRLREGGCKLFDYVASREALGFWRDMYSFMKNGHFSEDQVFGWMDPTGELRAMYPRPANFPDCFASHQSKPATKPSGGGGPMPVGAMSPAP